MCFSGASALLGTTGFIGFSDVALPGTRGTSLGGFSEGASSGPVSVTPFYAGDDSDLNVVCKRLSKKDRYVCSLAVCIWRRKCIA